MEPDKCTPLQRNKPAMHHCTICKLVKLRMF